MLSTNIKDYADIGLNADWCVSTYQMDSNDNYIFDNENDTFSLAHVLSYDGWKEEAYTFYITGTFEECTKYYEKEVKR